MTIIADLEQKINNAVIFSDVYSITRTFLALSTILTLLFNSTDVLMPFDRDLLPLGFLPFPTFFEVNFMFNISLETTRYIMIMLLIPTLLGYFPWVFGIVHWYICYSLQNNGLVIDGGEQIATVLTFLLIPLTIIDNRKNHWLDKSNDAYIPFYKKSIYFLGIWLMKIQIMIIYTHAAIGRLDNAEWGEGTALYYFFSDPMVGLPEHISIFILPIIESKLVVPITWLVTVFEMLLVTSIFWSYKYKKYILILGIMFHVFTAITIGIVTFGITMIGALIIYLYPNSKNMQLKF